MLNSSRIQNDNLSIDLLDFGARIQGLQFQGQEVALSYPNFSDFEQDIFYLGATVGPIANRLRGGKLSINEKTYQLPQNEFPNCLHSGGRGLEQMIWQTLEQSNSSLSYSCQFDMQTIGMEGILDCRADYQLSGSILRIRYLSHCTADCYLNLTNHVYLNLNGSGSVLEHDYLVHALAVYKRGDDHFPSTTLETLTTPSELDLSATGFDGFLDHHFVVASPNQGESTADNLHNYIDVSSAVTGIGVVVRGTAPGFQLYTGAGLSKPFVPSSGFCVEPQFTPDAINRRDASPIIQAGEKSERVIEYEFYS